MRTSGTRVLTIAGMLVLAAGLLTAANDHAKALAQKGLSSFHDVLGGDASRLEPALTDLVASREADPKSTANLYVLARAHFFDFSVRNNLESGVKARQIVEEMLALDPDNVEALSFRGSLLTALSQGKDIPMFMQGVQDLNRAVDRAPGNVNNRLVRFFTTAGFPPQAMAAMGRYDRIEDIRAAKQGLDGNAFFYAPHAQVVATALLGDALISAGKTEQGRAELQAALDYRKPSDSMEAAGRRVLDGLIQERLAGNGKPLVSGLMGSCYSCHLNAPDKLTR